jgi:hypothetical protein
VKVGVGLLLAAGLVAQAPASDAWLSWTSREAQQVGRAAYVRGRVGGIFDTRLLKTERSYNYKLAATWLRPDVIRASARLVQLAERLPDTAARALVTEAEAAGGTVVMVEIDPREGSGIIPGDWLAFLQPILPGGVEGAPVRGRNEPALRDVRALAGVLRRNYDYDRFWVVFPDKREDGAPTIPPEATGLELIVRIFDREGRVRWDLP